MSSRGRLIQQHNRRLLGQHHRNPRPLPLAAGKRVDALQRQIADPGRPHRLVHRLFIFFAPAGKQRLVRIAPAGHQLLHRDIARVVAFCASSPMRRATSLLAYCWICAPSSQTWPLAGVIRRLRVRNSVDLPQPLGPIMAVKWPSGMVTFSDSAMVLFP